MERKSEHQLVCGKRKDGNAWEGGEYERIEKRNRAALQTHFDQLDAAAVAFERASGPIWEQACADFCAVCGGDDDLVDRLVLATADQWETICRDCLESRHGFRVIAPREPEGVSLAA